MMGIFLHPRMKILFLSQPESQLHKHLLEHGAQTGRAHSEPVERVPQVPRRAEGARPFAVMNVGTGQSSASGNGVPRNARQHYDA